MTLPTHLCMTMAALLCLSAVSAAASTYDLSYTDGPGGVLTARISGALQGDGDTVEVTSVTHAAYNGTVGPTLGYVISFERALWGGSTPAHLSLSGAIGDLYACTDSSCHDGFAFIPAFAAGSNLYASGAFFGARHEAYRPANYALTLVSSVPIPAAGGLLMLALGGLTALRRKRV